LFTITIAQQMHGFSADIATDYGASRPTAPSLCRACKSSTGCFLTPPESLLLSQRP